MKVAYISDEVFLEHNIGSMQLKSSERLKYINKDIESLILEC